MAAPVALAARREDEGLLESASAVEAASGQRGPDSSAAAEARQAAATALAALLVADFETWCEAQG